jgi:hypothetical protein
MPGKIKKIKTLLNKRTKLRGAVNKILYDESTNRILEKYGFKSLPEVSYSELAKVFPVQDTGGQVTITSDLMNGSSPINDYYFLCQMARALNVKKYFEIGTWVGLSAFNMAKNSGKEVEIFSLDIPFDHPEIKIFDIPTEIFGHFSKDCQNVTHLKADSLSFDFTPFEKQFELIFVDGNHSFEYVKSDSKNALSLLKDDSSVIAWHDYILGGELNVNVLCGILEGIPAGEHKHLIHLYQSNMALFSRSFKFNDASIPQWSLPDTVFEFAISPVPSAKKGIAQD